MTDSEEKKKILGWWSNKKCTFLYDEGTNKNLYTCSSYNIIVTTISCKQLMTVTPIRKVHFSNLINK